jgi:hypothetical protein
MSFGLDFRRIKLKIAIRLRGTMDKTAIILAIPGIIVALPVLFDAVFRKI